MTLVSLGRRLLVVVYVATAVVTVLTVASLATEWPDFWTEGSEIAALRVVTLLVFVVGFIALIDFFRWPKRREMAPGIRLLSTGLVVVAFIGGYVVGSRVVVEFSDVGPMDIVVSVIGPGDPTLSVAGGVIFGCLAAALLWLGVPGLRPEQADA